MALQMGQMSSSIVHRSSKQVAGQQLELPSFEKTLHNANCQSSLAAALRKALDNDNNDDRVSVSVNVLPFRRLSVTDNNRHTARFSKTKGPLRINKTPPPLFSICSVSLCPSLKQVDYKLLANWIIRAALSLATRKALAGVLRC